MIWEPWELNWIRVLDLDITKSILELEQKISSKTLSFQHLKQLNPFAFFTECHATEQTFLDVGLGLASMTRHMQGACGTHLQVKTTTSPEGTLEIWILTLYIEHDIAQLNSFDSELTP